MNRYKTFWIEALSNMHVGSGDTNFGIVDNLIQRNPVTQIPVIHSSGIKGALKDHFKQISRFRANMKDLFGDDGNAGESFPGRLIFFEANLLALPLRSNRKVFYYATTPFIIMELISYIKDFSNVDYDTSNINNWLSSFVFDNDTPFYTFDTIAKPEIEYLRCDKKGTFNDKIKDDIMKLTGIPLTEIALFNDAFFKKICERSIPVVARNKIGDDGESENLFYEEILPRKTKLYFIIGEEDNLLKEKYDEFVKQLVDTKTVVQFGGNYSVGYGFSRVNEITLT